MRSNSRPSRARVRNSRLTVSALENRVTPAAKPAALIVDASHPFVTQLAAAKAGDVLQIEPGAVVGALGTTATLMQNASAGDTTIQVDHPFAVGQVVTVNYFGLTYEDALVDGVAGAASPFTLTLHSPLANAYPMGGLTAVTAKANTLGIGKGITIQGDPKKPAATLFNATTLQLFPQNGAAAPNQLANLALLGVQGLTSSNLTITGDSFTADGSVMPISVACNRAIALTNNSFTVGSAATQNNVIAATTNAGSITFAKNSVTTQSDVSGTVVQLISTSGPVSVSDLQLTAQGQVGGDGLLINAGGNVTVGGKSDTLSFAKTLSLNGVEILGGANVNVSNVTATATADVDGYGIYLKATGDVAARNLSATVGGNVGSDAIYVNASGSGAVSDLSSAVTGTASSGMQVSVNGNLKVGGAESVTVKGAVTNYGMYLFATDGALTASSPLSVTLGSTAGYGLYLDASSGALAVSKASAALNGDIANTGVYLYSYSGTTVSGLTAMLNGKSGQQAVYSDSYYGDQSISGLTVNETGAAAGNGVELHAENANLSLAKSTITMGAATTGNVLEMDAPHGNATLTKTTVTSKAVGNAGFTATAAGTLTVAKNSFTTVGGTAAKLTGSSGDPQLITKNSFNTGGTGTGLAFIGGSSVVAMVSGNNFQGNLVGVSITGDGTDAGNVDLGGGLLGSKGKNDFSGFTGTGGNYAIALSSTDATSSVFALGNKFTASDPTTLIQDQAHNGGTGIVKLS
jgi:hypothetical protein